MVEPWLVLLVLRQQQGNLILLCMGASNCYTGLVWRVVYIIVYYCVNFVYQVLLCCNIFLLVMLYLYCVPTLPYLWGPVCVLEVKTSCLNTTILCHLNLQLIYVLSVFVLSVFVLSVFVLSVIVLSVFVPSVFELSVIVLSVFVLSEFLATNSDNSLTTTSYRPMCSEA
jgi:hypothetical protein